MSILTPLYGSEILGTVRVFAHPADVYKPFACNCNGPCRPTETPDFEPDLDMYRVMARCGDCGTEYFVVGVEHQDMFDEARFEIMDFFMNRRLKGS